MGGLSAKRLSLDEIRWLKKDEISWKGEKYDLLRYRVAGDTLVAMAYHDAEEKDLENCISESRDEQNLSACCIANESCLRSFAPTGKLLFFIWHGYMPDDRTILHTRFKQRPSGCFHSILLELK